MRNKKGQFIKGQRSSPATEFKKGQHWRAHQPFHDKEWLEREYVQRERSTSDIAQEFNVTDANILYWLRKHGIPRRTISQAREVKHWGVVGEQNPLFGKKGALHYNWRGGLTPERQTLYSSQEWGNAIKAVWKRDRGICQRCGVKPNGRGQFHIHHIVTFAYIPLRAEPSNLVLLCKECHNFVHSKRNINSDFIKEPPE